MNASCKAADASSALRSRRWVLLRLSLAPAAAWLAADAAAQPGSEDAALVEPWMSAWMSVGRPVSGTLHLTRFKEPIYVLTQPIHWTPGPGAAKLPGVTVPIGFVTDFASIPRLFWTLLRPDGAYTYPAIIHDYLYWTQSTTRESADEVFRLAMEDFAIDRPTADAIHAAVRALGGSAWNANRRLQDAGEKRVLKRLPEDPRMSWAQWKTQPDVF